jgi:hypothetical protein
LKVEDFEVFCGDKQTSRWILSTAIGGSYLERWKSTAYKSWLSYGSKHDIGIAIATKEIFEGSQPPRNGSWQKMLLTKVFSNRLGRDIRCALMDTDLFVSPLSSNIFDAVPSGKIGVVSQEFGIPYERVRLRSRIGFLRREFMDKSFPLSSLLNASPTEVMRSAGLQCSLNNYFCAGLIVLDSKTHGDIFERWYVSAPDDEAYRSVGAWEEPWLNFCVQSSPDLYWLDYKWHALWLFEVASYYPFLYSMQSYRDLSRWCFASSLMRNNMLHLAGRWESSLLPDFVPTLPCINEEFGDFCDRLAIEEVASRVGTLLETLIPPRSMK